MPPVSTTPAPARWRRTVILDRIIPDDWSLDLAGQPAARLYAYPGEAGVWFWCVQIGAELQDRACRQRDSGAGGVRTHFESAGIRRVKNFEQSLP